MYMASFLKTEGQSIHITSLVFGVYFNFWVSYENLEFQKMLYASKKKLKIILFTAHSKLIVIEE